MQRPGVEPGLLSQYTLFQCWKHSPNSLPEFNPIFGHYYPQALHDALCSNALHDDVIRQGWSMERVDDEKGEDSLGLVVEPADMQISFNMARGLIYCATCTISGKKYIGQTIQSLKHRRGSHESKARCGSTQMAISCAIRKHGKENFTWEVLEECDVAELNDRESAAIATHDTVAPRGYNTEPTGRGVAVHKEHKRKLDEDATLPHHVHRCEHATGKGFRVMMPDGRRKAFLSATYTREEKLAMAAAWAERAAKEPAWIDTTSGHLRRQESIPPGVFRQDDRWMVVSYSPSGPQSISCRDVQEAVDVHTAMHALLCLDGRSRAGES